MSHDNMTKEERIKWLEEQIKSNSDLGTLTTMLLMQPRKLSSSASNHNCTKASSYFQKAEEFKKELAELKGETSDEVSFSAPQKQNDQSQKLNFLN
jgi:hypothetical protein